MERLKALRACRVTGAVVAAAFCIFAAQASPAPNADASLESAPTTAPEPSAAQLKKEQALLERLEQIEAEHGSVSGLAIAPLLNLGGLYIEQERCTDAVAVLTQGLKLSRALDGLFNLQQMELVEPLMDCYLALDLVSDFEREQRYAQLVSDTNFGKSDPRALPALQRIGLWYEQAGWYISAREIYTRTLELTRRTGDNMSRLGVAPLRSLARTFRLEYRYGLDVIDSEAKRGSLLRSRAYLQNGKIVPDRLGEDSLKRAVALLRGQPDADRGEFVETLLELGDWYQMAAQRREALRAYQEAWRESSAPGYAGDTLFEGPVPVLYRAQDGGGVMRRPPPNRENFKRYWVGLEYTVTRDGEVKDVKVTESNAPQAYQWRVKDSLRQMRFRPRFVEGEPVDSLHVTSRQGMWVEKQKWSFKIN